MINIKNHNMKSEILKIAGVKNVNEFYKKYPTEASFYKAHPEAKHLKSFKKGGEMKKLEQLTDFGNPPKAVDGYPTFQQVASQSFKGGCGPGQQKNPFTGACEPKPTFGVTGTPGLSFNPNQQGFIRNPTTGKYEQPQMFGADAASSKTSFLDKMGGPEGIANMAGGVIQGIRQEKDWRKQRDSSDTALKVAMLTAKASESRPKEPLRRYYNRPENIVINPEELFPTYGVGSNILSSAKDGAMIGGNPTEIQNMYNPRDMYSDLGYEPMNESDIVKQYEEGGYVPKAQLGDIVGQMGGVSGILNQVGGLTGTGAGSSGIYNTIGNIGSKLVPGAAGAFLGPLGAAVQFGINDARARKLRNDAEMTQRSLQKAAFESGIQGLQSQYAGVMKNGGALDSDYEWISHTWQPQVITKFGDMDVSQIHSFATEGMDSLRTGGRITQNNMYPQDQFNFGGELQTTWGGRAKPISYNPYLPGSGETVMFEGNSHEEKDNKGRTGIGVKYGNDGDYSPYMEYGRDGVEDVTDVEVEKGEPATELQDSTGDTSMVVFGNLKIPKQFIGEIGDDSIKYGEKFKTYADRISRDEAKQNKIVDKASQLIDIHDDGTPFGELAMNSAKAMMDGANQTLKNIAQFKKNAAAVQNAINETAEENMIDADALAKGKIKIDKEAMKQQAKWGKDIKKAQTGTTTSGETVDQAIADRLNDMFTKAKNEKDKAKKKQLTEAFQKEFHKYFPEKAKEIILKDKDVTTKGKGMGIKSIEDLKGKDLKTILETNEDALFGDRTEQYNAIAQSSVKKDPVKIPEDVPTIPTTDKTTTVAPTVPVTTEKKKPDWLQGLNTLLPYLQRPYESGMPNLYKEMMALSMNVLDPVKAQGVQPLLETPYDISLQDQLNEITASERAAQKMAMGDPSAMANISAQSQAAKQKVLADQFRMNQAMKAGVYGRNRAALNEAQLQNLEIFADQEAKQQLAKSKTKATALEAMGSISDKIEKRRAEERNVRLLEQAFPNYRLQRNMQLTPSQLTLFDMGTTGVPAGATPPYVASGRTAGSTTQTSSLANTPTSSSTTPSTNNVSQTLPADMDFIMSPSGIPVPMPKTSSAQVPNLMDIFNQSFKTEKNGGITKKKHFNGSIVRALKNI